MEFKCNRCNKGFARKGDLKKHTAKKYPCKEAPKLSFECDNCKRTFTTKGNMQRHKEQVCTLKPDNSTLHPQQTQLHNGGYPQMIPQYPQMAPQYPQMTPQYPQMIYNQMPYPLQYQPQPQYPQMQYPCISNQSADDLVAQQGNRPMVYPQVQYPQISFQQVPIDRTLNDTPVQSGEVMQKEKGHDMQHHKEADKHFLCEFCNKKYSRKDVLLRHIDHNCKKRRLDLQQANAAIQSASNVANVTSNHNSNNNNNNTKNSNNINTINNNNINIKLVAFETDGHPKISNSVWRQIFEKGFQAVPALMKYLHFNEKRPGEQNIYISDLKQPYVRCFDGKRWNATDRDKLIDDIYNDKVSFLEMKFGDLYSILDQKTIDKMERFIATYDEDYVQKTAKSELKLILYNKRHIPKNTWNRIIAQEKNKAKQLK